MRGSPKRMSGEFIFRTKDGGRALIFFSQGNGTFTLRRMMQGGPVDERSNFAVYHGCIDGYISEVTLEWNDLEREGAEWKPTS